MWPPEAGIRPYQSGHADQVVKVDWREGSVFSPPSGWFHQHFNTGNEKARQLAFRYSGQSGKYLLGCWRAINKEGVRTSVRDGGTMIEYEDEDPQIRLDFEASIDKIGVPMEMPQFEYARLMRCAMIGSFTLWILFSSRRSRFAPCAADCAKRKIASEWEKTVELAKKEGKVVISIPASTELRAAIERSFEKRYGVDVEPVVGRASAVVRKMVDESKAGVRYVDLHMGGSESIVTGMLPEGILEPIEPLMLLAEVKDPKQWWGGHVWVDNAKRFVYSTLAYQTENLWINTQMMKADDIRSFDDLLDERLKDRIGMLDPRTAGSGASTWSYLREIKGEDYLKKIGRPETGAQPRSARACGDSRQGKNRAGDGLDLLLLHSVHQGGLAGGAAAGA